MNENFEPNQSTGKTDAAYDNQPGLTVNSSEAPVNDPEAPVHESSAPILEFCHVTKKYGSKVVLNDLSFAIAPGGIIGLLGPNGCGKTTIIKLINRLLVPNSGEILINNMKPCPETAEIVAYLPDRDVLPKSRSVKSLVNLYADFYKDFDKEKAYEMLELLKIEPKTPMKSLSKGNREKVQLILTMSRRALLYVLDEPIGGVDPAARDFILDTIIKSRNNNSSILIATHLISDVEPVLDDVLLLSGGKLAVCASVKSINETYGKSVDEYFREIYKVK